MKDTATYALQSRWLPKGRALTYYGLRCGKDMFRNTIRLNKRQSELISALPKELTKREVHIVKPLIGTQIVPSDEVRAVPKSINEATFCRNCCANDFIIPGLEFTAGSG